MNLIDYIKMSYKRPNRKILESLEASEALIEYLEKTPHNTNFVIASQLASSGGGSSDTAVVDSAVVDSAIAG